MAAMVLVARATLFPNSNEPRREGFGGKWWGRQPDSLVAWWWWRWRPWRKLTTTCERGKGRWWSPWAVASCWSSDETLRPVKLWRDPTTCGGVVGGGGGEARLARVAMPNPKLAGVRRWRGKDWGGKTMWAELWAGGSALAYTRWP